MDKAGAANGEGIQSVQEESGNGTQNSGNIPPTQDIIPGVLYHHERWDGRGYPNKVGAEDIPLMGRIICVADSFDAMSTTRTYRPALPLETVLEEIKRCAGTQFDPKLAPLFVTMD